MLRQTRRIGFVLCAILLASCAQSTQSADEESIVVTGNRTDQAAPVVPPPMAPPAPVMALSCAVSFPASMRPVPLSVKVGSP